MFQLPWQMIMPITDIFWLIVTFLFTEEGMFDYSGQYSWTAVYVLAADWNVCCLFDIFESILVTDRRTNILYGFLYTTIISFFFFIQHYILAKWFITLLFCICICVLSSSYHKKVVVFAIRWLLLLCCGLCHTFFSDGIISWCSKCFYVLV